MNFGRCNAFECIVAVSCGRKGLYGQRFAFAKFTGPAGSWNWLNSVDMDRWHGWNRLSDRWSIAFTQIVQAVPLRGDKRCQMSIDVNSPKLSGGQRCTQDNSLPEAQIAHSLPKVWQYVAVWHSKISKLRQPSEKRSWKGYEKVMKRSKRSWHSCQSFVKALACSDYP